MSLKKVLIKTDVIQNDKDFMEAEHDAMVDYCKKKGFVLSDEDMDELRARGLEEDYEDCKLNHMTDISSEIPWYTENWYDQDLLDAMYSNNIPLTKENLVEFRNYCKFIFDEMSARNEMLWSAASEFFDRIYVADDESVKDEIPSHEENTVPVEITMEVTRRIARIYNVTPDDLNQLKSGKIPFYDELYRDALQNGCTDSDCSVTDECGKVIVGWTE